MSNAADVGNFVWFNVYLTGGSYTPMSSPKLEQKDSPETGNTSETPLYGKVFIGRNCCSGKQCDSWASCLKVNKLNTIPGNFAVCQ